MQNLWPVVLLAALAASAQQHQPGAGVNFYSKTKEIAAGQQMASQFRHDTTPLGNAAVGDYVNRVGAALAAQFPADGHTSLRWSRKTVTARLSSLWPFPAARSSFRRN